jgi:hypothetical protein
VGRKKKVAAAGEGLDELRELVDQPGDEPKAQAKNSRRDLLKLAGAAIAGAAGATALRAVPAAALTGQYVVQGQINLQTGDAPTILSMGGSTGPLSSTGASLIGQSAAGLFGSGYWVVDHTQEIGLLGVSKGSNGDGSNGPGTGVMGLSHAGSGGNFMSATGYDAQLGALAGDNGTLGSGRLAMIGRGDVGGVAPNWNPAFFTHTSFGILNFQHEFVRGTDGSIWASRAVKIGSGIAPKGRWKRINAVRVDSSDGTGATFKPFRAIDTRVTSSPPIGTGGRPAHGTVTTPNFHVVNIAGTGTGTSAIPADAVAVMGNLTAVGYSGAGFLAIMPGGIVAGTGAGQYNPAKDPSSVNFIVGQAAIANAFVCGLHNGQLQVFIGLQDAHFIVDITAYLQ